jgi:transcription elongation factor Elf1
MLDMIKVPRPLKERYDFSCCGCGHEQSLAPSIMMEMGINSGHGRCSKCAMFLHLELKQDNSGAISTPHSEYVENMQKANA